MYQQVRTNHVITRQSTRAYPPGTQAEAARASSRRFRQGAYGRIALAHSLARSLAIPEADRPLAGLKPQRDRTGRGALTGPPGGRSEWGHWCGAPL